MTIKAKTLQKIQKHNSKAKSTTANLETQQQNRKEHNSKFGNSRKIQKHNSKLGKMTANS